MPSGKESILHGTHRNHRGQRASRRGRGRPPGAARTGRPGAARRIGARPDDCSTAPKNT